MKKLLFLPVLFCLCLSLKAAPTVVGTPAATVPPSGTSGSITANLTQHNTALIGLRLGSAAALSPTPAVTCSGETVVEIATLRDGGDNQLHVYQIKDVQTTGSKTVSATWTGSTTNRFILAEVTGTYTPAPVDASASNNGTDALPRSTPFAANYNDELLIGFFDTSDGRTITGTNGFTNIKDVDGKLALLTRSVTSFGTYEATAALTGGPPPQNQWAVIGFGLTGTHATPTASPSPSPSPSPTSSPSPTATPLPPTPTPWNGPNIIERNAGFIIQGNKLVLSTLSPVLAHKTLLLGVYVSGLEDIDGVVDNADNSYVRLSPDYVSGTATHNLTVFSVFDTDSTGSDPLEVTINFTGSVNAYAAVYVIGDTYYAAPIDDDSFDNGAGNLPATSSIVTTRYVERLFGFFGLKTASVAQVPPADYPPWTALDRIPYTSHTSLFTTTATMGDVGTVRARAKMQFPSPWSGAIVAVRGAISTTPTATPTASPSPSPSPTPTATPTPAATGTPSANKFVRSSSTGAANGNDWNNAWSITNLNSNWSNVAAGTTVWFAGGTYTSSLHINKSGTQANPIVIQRATVDDTVATGAAGWSAGFDSQVIIAPSTYSSCIYWDNGANGSYVIIDGRTDYGIKGIFPLPSCPSGGDAHLGGIAFHNSVDGVHDVIIRHVEITSAGTPTCGNSAGVNAFSNGPVFNLTLSHVSVHKFLNLIRCVSGPNATNWLLEYMDLYDCTCTNTAGDHGNLFELEHIHDSTLRYSKIHDWGGQGWNINKVNVPMNWYFYGNSFYGQLNRGNCATSAFWNCQGGSVCTGTYTGPAYFYNNTFYGVDVTVGQERAVQFGNGSVSRNNIFWNSGNTSQWPTDQDYDFFSGTATGAHSINANGQCPFPAGCTPQNTDFRIKDTVAANYPKNKGAALGSIPVGLNIDAAGTIRGSGYLGDTLWDIGAYENTSTNTAGPSSNGSGAIPFPKLWP